MGPVMGAISERHGSPVIQLRSRAKARNESTYVALMWKRRKRQMTVEPRIQITIIGQTKLPHWILSPATVPDASTNSAAIPKLEGFQICRSCTRSTYFEVMEMRAQSA